MRVVWDDTSWPVKAEWPRMKPAKRRRKKKEEALTSSLSGQMFPCTSLGATQYKLYLRLFFMNWYIDFISRSQAMYF